MKIFEVFFENSQPPRKILAAESFLDVVDFAKQFGTINSVHSKDGEFTVIPPKPTDAIQEAEKLQ